MMASIMINFEDCTDSLEYNGTPAAWTRGASVPLVQLEVGPTLRQVVKTPFYVRDHVMTRKQELDSFVIAGNPREPYLLTLWMTGPPGCGKTSMLSLWARIYARQQAKRVLIINYFQDARNSQPLLIAVFDPTSAWCAELKEGTIEQKAEAVWKFLNDSEEANEFDLAVFDGCIQSNVLCDEVMSLINDHVGGTIAKVVFATSHSFRVRGQDGILGENYNILYLNSWTFEEHEQAFRAFCAEKKLQDMLVDDIKQWRKGVRRLDELGNVDGQEAMVDAVATDDDDKYYPSEADVLLYLEMKFYFAGGSVRFMHRFSVEALKTELQRLIRAVGDDASNWGPFSKKDVSAGTSTAVNSLMQHFVFKKSGTPRRCLAVSQYVLLYASEKCKDSLIGAGARTMAELTGNPSLRGWAFELEQLQVIKSFVKEGQNRPDAYIQTDEGLVLRPTRQVAYDGTSFDPSNPQMQDGELTVIWCLKWNQGCFHVAFYKNGTLATLQFTISTQQHSLKLQYITELRAALQAKGHAVNDVIHIAVVEDNVNAFSFKAAEGTGRNNCQIEYVAQINRTSALKPANAAGAVAPPESLSVDAGHTISIEVHNDTKMPPGPGLI